MKNKVVIDVWVADLTFPGYMDRLNRLGEEFGKAHPDYEVKIRGVDFRTLSQEISEGNRAGNPPAIAEYYSYMTPVARDSLTPDGRPLFTAIGKAIAGRREILGEPVVVDDLNPAIRDYYSYRGELLSMPMVVTTMLAYANRTLLKAAGIAAMPRTWEELEAACELVGKIPDSPPHAITWANHGFFFQQGIAVQGGGLANAEDGRSGRATTLDLASNEMMAWVTWWRHMHRAGHYLYTGKIPDWAGNLKAFADQQVAFRLTSSNDVNYMVQAAKNGGFGIEVSRFPYRGGVPYGGHVVAGTSLWLRDGLDEATQDGALAFMQYLNNPGNAADQHRVNSFVPVTESAFDLLEKEGWFAEHPHHRVASEQLKAYPPGAEIPAGAGPPNATPPARGAMIGDYAGVQDVLTLAMADILLQDADPLTRLTEATAAAQTLLDAYHADCAGAGPHSPNSLRMEYFRDAEEYSGATLEAVVRLDR
jgi:sn-glycerol 3-phosphate transport system substrate-binding protein